MPHPSNGKRAPANLYKAPRLPRTISDKKNCYGTIIEDSDEDRVMEFTGPRSGRFLVPWHDVHEKSYNRKKQISEMREEARQHTNKIKELQKKIDALTPGAKRQTEKVCNIPSRERIRGRIG